MRFEITGEWIEAVDEQTAWRWDERLRRSLRMEVSQNAPAWPFSALVSDGPSAL
jgi:hypothetical protein